MGITRDQETTTMVPFLNYFDYNDDYSTKSYWDEEKQGLVVAAAK